MKIFRKKSLEFVDDHVVEGDTKELVVHCDSEEEFDNLILLLQKDAMEKGGSLEVTIEKGGSDEV